MRLLLTTFLFLNSILIFAQSSENLSLLGSLSYTEELSDIWAYVDVEGNEFALVGVYNGFSVVDVTIADNPEELFFIEGPNSIWRDVKIWSHYAYVTNETSNGLLIIDLSDLSGNTYIEIDSIFNDAHNIYIDENGYAYIFGANIGNGGALILDVHTDPMNPFHLGTFSDFYLHDGMVRGDTLWGAAVYEGNFYAIDVSDKSNPFVMNNGQAFHTTPHAFTHNCWISDNGKTLFTTDETGGAYLTSYDVSDLDNIYELDRIQSSPGSDVIPHNTHVLGNFLITSYYRDGVVVHDVTYPNNMVEVAHYDAYAGAGDGFDGSWGVYPFLPSGNILSSEINSGDEGEGILLVLRPEYDQACFFEGSVTDQAGNELNNVSISILETEFETTTNLLGDYLGGIANTGTYQVVFELWGFEAETLEVNLINGEIVILDAVLSCEGSDFYGQILDDNGSPVSNVSILLENENIEYHTSTNLNGEFSIQCLGNGTYDLTFGAWGFVTQCLSVNIQGDTEVQYNLEEGYYDDFTFDFGWYVAGNVEAGSWERVVPIGTSYQNLAMAPALDVFTDCKNYAFVTGNGTGGVGSADVDSVTNLRSPEMDLSSYNKPILKYSRWIANAGGDGDVNDKFIISFYNPQPLEFNIEYILPNIETAGEWIDVEINITDSLDFSEPVTLLFHVKDNAPGHLVEAAFDNFQVVEGDHFAGINNLVSSTSVFPNPFRNSFTVNSIELVSKLNVYDVHGKLVYSKSPKKTDFICNANLTKGFYILELIFDSGKSEKVKIFHSN